MWFSSNEPARPRSRVSHATVVAYVALVVAALGIPAAAVAATTLAAPNSVNTRAIIDRAVTNPKLADNSVGNAKLRDLSVGNLKLRTNSVGNAKLRDFSVGNLKLRTNSVGTDNIKNNTLTGDNIVSGTIPGHDITPGSSTGDHIAANTITGDNINGASVATALPLVGVAQTFRSTGDVQISGSTDVPLSHLTGLDPGAYSQPAQSMDILTCFFAVRLPSTATTGCTGPALTVDVWASLNNESIARGQITVPFLRAAGHRTETGALTFDHPRATINTTNEPRPRTLRARVSASCANANGDYRQADNLTLTTLTLDVMRTRGAVPLAELGGS